MAVIFIDLLNPEENEEKPAQKEPEPTEEDSSCKPRLLRKQVIAIDGTIVDVGF